jgi:hypothetical protein
MFDAVERLKREFTDKYVEVDAARPELARFKGMTGQVKTVNMSGRALVQFDRDNNIGWYDIGLDFLKVVPKPEPKPEEAKAKPKSEKPQTSADSPAVAPKPVAGGEKAPTAAEKKPAAATGEKKPSVAEMLRAQAAAKAAGGAAPVAKEPAGPAKAPVVKVEDPGLAATGEIPAVEKVEKTEEKKSEEAKPAGEKKKLSTAEILAALKKKP